MVKASDFLKHLRSWMAAFFVWGVLLVGVPWAYHTWWPAPVPVSFVGQGEWTANGEWVHTIWVDVESHCVLLLDRQFAKPDGTLVSVAPTQAPAFEPTSSPYVVDTRNSGGVIGAGELGPREPIIYRYGGVPRGLYARYIVTILVVSCDNGYDGELHIPALDMNPFTLGPHP